MRRALVIALVGLLWLTAAGSVRAAVSPRPALGGGTAGPALGNVAAPSPPPVGPSVPLRGVAMLTGLACGGPTACMVLGQDAAGDWIVVPVDAGVPGAGAAVPAAPANDELTLTALACASPTLCEAVGSLTDADGDTLAAVVSIRSGQPGAPQVVTEPDGSSGAYDALSAVACPSASVCEAVGEGEDAQSVQIADGVPGPLDHDDDPMISTLNGILCAGGGCVALGSGGADGETGIVVGMDGPSLGAAAAVAHTASFTVGACPPASGGSGGSGGPGGGGSGCVLLGADTFGHALLVGVGAGGLGAPAGFAAPARVLGQPVGAACPTAGSCVLLSTDEQGAGTLVPLAVSAFGAVVGTTVPFPVASAGAPVCVSASSCLAVGTPNVAPGGTTGASAAAAIVTFGQSLAEIPFNVGAAHVHGTAASLVVSCSQPCAGRVVETARLTHHPSRVVHPRTVAPGPGRPGAHPRTIAVARPARFRLAALGRRTVTLRLDRAGRRALAVVGRLPVLLTVLTRPSRSTRPQIAAIRSATLRRHVRRRGRPGSSSQRAGPARARARSAGGPRSSGVRPARRRRSRRSDGGAPAR